MRCSHVLVVFSWPCESGVKDVNLRVAPTARECDIISYVTNLCTVHALCEAALWVTGGVAVVH